MFYILYKSVSTGFSIFNYFFPRYFMFMLVTQMLDSIIYSVDSLEKLTFFDD